MNRNRVLQCAMVVFCGMFLGVGWSEAADDDHLWIRVDGTNFVTSPLADPPNQVFVPVGVATGRKSVDENLMRFCKAHGMNTMRLYFQTNNPNGGEWDFDAELARIAALVTMAKQNQIYTVLDNHHVFGGPWEAWWINDGEIERWMNNYGRVADYFKDEPWIIGYEVMNEAYVNRVPGLGPDEVKAQLKNCALRIREYDTRHILFLPFRGHLNDQTFYPGGFFASDFDVLDPPQVAITPHYYPPNSPVTPDGFGHCTELNAWRAENNVPVFVSEFCGGFAGNGYTHDHNKTWLRGIMDGLNEFNIAWTIQIYSGTGGLFPTLYGPDDPEIWRPVSIEMGARNPVPSRSAAATGVVIEAAPQWFPGISAGEEMEVTVKIVDACGAVIAGSSAAVSLSISGPGTLTGVPSGVTNGKATVKLRAGDSEGTIVITGSSAGLQAGTLEIPVTRRWSGFQTRTNGGVWADAGGADVSSPQCRVRVCDPGLGVNLRKARYEYTTNGGASWVYWDAAESDEFDSPLDMSRWTAQDVNTTGGSANVSDGVLTLRGRGEDVWSTWPDTWYMTPTYAKDEYFSIHEEKTGDFEIVTKVLSQENTDPLALAGIVARNDMTLSCVYLAVTPENGVVFAWQDLGHMINGGDGSSNKYAVFKYIDSRVFGGTTTYPLYLKLEKTMHPGHFEAQSGYYRNMQIYSGYYSTDGVNWVLVRSKAVMGRFTQHAKNTQRVGLFVCSRSATTFGEAQFEFYRSALTADVEGVDVKAPHAIVSQGGSYPYSVESQYLTTATIPFDGGSAYSQKVRFKIRSQVPYLDYMNNPGEQFVSQEYVLNSGIDVSVHAKVADVRPLGVRAYSADGAVRIAYSVSGGEYDALAFSIYRLDGRKVWSTAVSDPAGSGTIVWGGRGSGGAAAGMYVLRVGGKTKGSNQSRVLRTQMVYPEMR